MIKMVIFPFETIVNIGKRSEKVRNERDHNRNKYVNNSVVVNSWTSLTTVQ